MVGKKSRTLVREDKHRRVRNRFAGTPERPRLAVFRSNDHMYAQIIDDTVGKTLVSSSSKVLAGELKSTSSIEASKAVGKDIAAKAQEAGIKTVVFDRGGYIYHGRVKELAEAAREAGLEF